MMIIVVTTVNQGLGMPQHIDIISTCTVMFEYVIDSHHEFKPPDLGNFTKKTRASRITSLKTNGWNLEIAPE